MVHFEPVGGKSGPESRTTPGTESDSESDATSVTEPAPTSVPKSGTVGLAPVTYLRGRAPAASPVREARSPSRATPKWYVAEDGPDSVSPSGSDAGDTFDDDSASTDSDAVAAVTLMPRFRAMQPDAAPDSDLDSDADSDDDTPGFEDDGADDDGDAPFDPAEERERAEQLLLRRLRSRSLSRKEATAILAGTDIEADEVEDILVRFTELHYIDEVRLADQIIHSHHERKGLGRSGVAAEMRKRGIDPFLIEEKLEELPDDETERAVELACARIRQLDRFDDQTIDRRLTGFLLRKGYGSAAVRVAITAALASRRASGKSSGVRFR